MRRMSKRDIDDVFDHLDTFGWINKVTDKNGTTHGIVNPRVHTLFAERGKQEAKRASEAKKMILDAIERRRKNA
jgi:hypothetical protein